MRRQLGLILGFACVLAIMGIGSAQAAFHGIATGKSCASPVKIGDPYFCSVQILNVVDTGHDTLRLTGLSDVVDSAGGAVHTGNILPSTGLVFNGAATCTGGSGAGTSADPYFGATECLLPFNSTIQTSLFFSHYTVQASDFNLPNHRLTDTASVNWNNTCVSDPDNDCTTAAQTATAGSSALVRKLISTTATDIHTAAHTVVTAVAAGSTVHDFVTVTGQPAPPTPSGNVNIDWFLNGTCDGAPAANSVDIALNASGEVDATGFGFTVNTAGLRGFKAHYAGDATYLGSDGACEPLQVVDADIQISPLTATNEIGTTQTFTAHVNLNAGTGSANASGALVTFSIDSGPGSLSNGNVSSSSCSTNASGGCTVDLNSATPGVTTLSAHTTLSVAGVSLTRNTDGVGANSPPARTTWGVKVGGALKFLACYEGAVTTTGGCARVHGFGGLGQMAADDAGANLYVTARTAGATGSALAVFSRNGGTGALAQIECFSAPGNTEGCTPVGASSSDSPMVGLVDVVVSHDGKNVYAASGTRSALAEWSRASDGSLTYMGCVTSPGNAALTGSGCATALGMGTGTAAAIAIDPAGTTVYLAGYAKSMIGVLQRTVSGTLLQPIVGGASPWCVSFSGADENGNAGKCLTDSLLSGPHHVQASTDGTQLLVAADGTSAIIGYGRNGDGSLTLGSRVCVSATGGGGCNAVLHLDGVDNFDISADGSRVYAAGRNDKAVVVIDRNTSTGALTTHPNTVDACWRNVLATPNCGYQDALLEPYDVKIAKDGTSVYVSTLSNHSIVEFDVQPDGGLVPKPAPFGCIYGGDFPLCMKLPIDSSVEGLATAGRNLYAALNNGGNGDRLLAWSIDRAPLCNPFSASTPLNTPIVLMLACADADGDTLTYSATPPVHGTLGAPLANGSISYAPQPNTLADDTFTFNATETIVTNPAGTGTHPSAVIVAGPATASVHVVKWSQSITFGALAAKTFGDADFALDASASSTLPVSFGASESCTVSGVTVHITGTGSCTVTASQAGDANYNIAADVAQTFAIGKAGQTITFDALANKTFGAADFTVGATASSGLAVSFSATGSCAINGATVHLTSAGSCTVTASQAGDANYNIAADVAQTFAIGKAGQTITFDALANKTFGAADFTVGATASSGLAVSFSATGSCAINGATVHLTSAGSCTVTAAQPGNANFNAATSVAQSFTITASLTPAKKCKVPKVVGKTLSAAKLALKARHCATGKVSRVYSRKARRGKVISQSRRSGKVLPAGTKVNLVVSRGRRPRPR